jgi:hypothetical protein
VLQYVTALSGKTNLISHSSKPKTFETAWIYCTVCSHWRLWNAVIKRAKKNYTAGWTVRGSNPCRGEILRKCPDRPWGHPASCTTDTGSFPGVESGQGVTLTPHPLLLPRSNNRVELYLYSPYGPSWPVKRVKPTYKLYDYSNVIFWMLFIFYSMEFVIVHCSYR